jgi:hypothetical protein
MHYPDVPPGLFTAFSHALVTTPMSSPVVGVEYEERGRHYGALFTVAGFRFAMRRGSCVTVADVMKAPVIPLRDLLPEHRGQVHDAIALWFMRRTRKHLIAAEA